MDGILVLGTVQNFRHKKSHNVHSRLLKLTFPFLNKLQANLLNLDTEAPTTDPEDPTFLPRITTYFTRDRIWDRKKPHWEFIVAENVQLPHSESSPKSFLILRAHHALGDGWSFFKATSKFLENPNILNNVKLPQFMGQSRSVGVCSRLWNSFWFWIKLPFETVENFLTVMPDRTEIPTFKGYAISNLF